MESLDEKSKKFIKDHLNSQIEYLILQNNSSQPQNIKVLIEQIKARQKIKTKLPNWFNNIDLILPKSVSVEQSSSEITSIYKASLVNGNLLIDLTGGMGIDFLEMAKNFNEAIYVERDSELKNITEFNFKQLGLENTSFYNQNSIDFIRNFTKKIDWIYIDPARRDSVGGKVFSLADCEPNILTIKDILLKKSENILVKCSPMLDINLAINQLDSVQNVYVITVDNEVKELLFHLKYEKSNSIKTKVVHIKKSKVDEFDFNMEEEKSLAYNIGGLEKYLFEPHAGIMKAGAFKTISKKYNCKKLNPNTHLYTSNTLIKDFPGRIFEILNILKPDKKEIKKKIINLQANLAIRNYPGTVDLLRKKLGIKDGGDQYLFACTDNFNQKLILQTIKIS